MMFLICGIETSLSRDGRGESVTPTWGHALFIFGGRCDMIRAIGPPCTEASLGTRLGRGPREDVMIPVGAMSRRPHGPPVGLGARRGLGRRGFFSLPPLRPTGPRWRGTGRRSLPPRRRWRAGRPPRSPSDAPATRRGPRGHPLSSSRSPVSHDTRRPRRPSSI